MAAVLFRLTSTPVFDTNGNPVSGALANWYLSGTLTRTPIYTDSGLSIEHENPVEANASGVLPSIYLDSDIAYRVIITDADGAELSDTDPYEDLDGAAVLAKLLTVDGSGSGLDADKLRGTTPTTFGLSLIDDAAASNARTTLGLGSMATQSSSNVTITGGSISVPLTINATAIAYQFVLEDAGKLVRGEAGGARVFTIPSNATVAFPAGTIIYLVQQDSGGSMILTPAVGVTLLFGASVGTATLSYGDSGMLIKVNSNIWTVFGSGIA
jgi:hypothetical protein